MKKILSGIALLAVCGLVLGNGHGGTSVTAQQDTLGAYKGNNCVSCHSRPQGIALDNRFFQWHSSIHREKDVSCDKCHGGDPAAADAKKGHAGMFPSANTASRLHPQNLPETCGSCHKEVVSSFVNSRHYQKLKDSGVGPSCSTCHVHMGSEVIHNAADTTTLCSTCHDSTNALMPKRPEIPGKAGEVIGAIKRANSVVVWAERLIEDGKNKKVDVSREEKEWQQVSQRLSEVKTSWHTFTLDTVRAKADAVFEQGTRNKDALRKKIYPEQ